MVTLPVGLPATGSAGSISVPRLAASAAREDSSSCLLSMACKASTASRRIDGSLTRASRRIRTISARWAGLKLSAARPVIGSSNPAIRAAMAVQWANGRTDRRANEDDDAGLVRSFGIDQGLSYGFATDAAEVGSEASPGFGPRQTTMSSTIHPRAGDTAGRCHVGACPVFSAHRCCRCIGRRLWHETRCAAPGRQVQIWGTAGLRTMR